MQLEAACSDLDELAPPGMLPPKRRRKRVKHRALVSMECCYSENKPTCTVGSGWMDIPLPVSAASCTKFMYVQYVESTVSRV